MDIWAFYLDNHLAASYYLLNLEYYQVITTKFCNYYLGNNILIYIFLCFLSFLRTLLLYHNAGRVKST
nr:CC chemokine-like protein [Oriental turtle dovepox virus]